MTGYKTADRRDVGRLMLLCSLVYFCSYLMLHGLGGFSTTATTAVF